MTLGQLKIGERFLFIGTSPKRFGFYIFEGWKDSRKLHVRYTDSSGLNYFYSNRLYLKVRIL